MTFFRPRKRYFLCCYVVIKRLSIRAATSLRLSGHTSMRHEAGMGREWKEEGMETQMRADREQEGRDGGRRRDGIMRQRERDRQFRMSVSQEHWAPSDSTEQNRAEWSETGHNSSIVLLNNQTEAWQEHSTSNTHAHTLTTAYNLKCTLPLQ